MNLIIDIGNTRTKLALFERQTGELIDKFVFDTDCFTTSMIDEKIKNKNEISSVIVSSVKKDVEEIGDYWSSKGVLCIKLTHRLPLPIKNKYHTPETLGKDRIAAVVAANNIFRNDNVLVIDMGTAITFDFVNNTNQYEGGNISPGMRMRFKALHYFTGRLPELESSEEYCLLGKTTEQAIVSGVQNGIIHEVDGYISTLKEKYKDLKVILTGGDSIFFDKKLKNTIFAQPNLVEIGLNIILGYNKTIIGD